MGSLGKQNDQGDGAPVAEADVQNIVSYLASQYGK